MRGVTDVFEAVYAWLNSFSALAFILVVIAILYLVRMLWQGAKVAIPNVKTAISFVEALFQLPKFMGEMRLEVREIKHEVLPNNGGSLRDDLETVTLMVEAQSLEMAQLKAHDESDHARLVELESTINRRREQRAIIQQEVDSGSADTFPTDVSEE